MPVEKEVAESYRRKGELLRLMNYPKEAIIYEEVGKKNIIMGENDFILNVTLEEFDSAGSKFAKAGLRLAELGMPEWETPGQSIRFPFFIIEEGPDNMKDGKLVTGTSKAAMWKLKEILEAAGVPATKTTDGEVTFDKAAVTGKQIKVLYTNEVDSRTPEEGGTGTKYTKASAAYPPNTTEESLGI